jgi:hypothetical protein
MSRSVPPRARRLIVATILTVATGCDKANAGLKMGGKSDDGGEPPASAQLDLAKRPAILFQVFGGRDDPRMIPLAALEGGVLKKIVLSSDNWRVFDTLYTRAGDSVTVYRDGRAAGAAKIRQRMWEKGTPLYTLPGCERLTPLAAVTVAGAPESDYTVEYLASTVKLGVAHDEIATLPSAEAARLARKVGEAVASDHAIGPEALADLDFRAIAVPTGATRQPTLVAAFMPPPALHADTRSGERRTSHVFALADARPDGYAVTFKHVITASGDDVDFRRYVDHLDLDGDRIDEIVLEAWKPGGDTFLLVLSFRGGAWEETFRGRESWCLDEKVK